MEHKQFNNKYTHKGNVFSNITNLINFLSKNDLIDVEKLEMNKPPKEWLENLEFQYYTNNSK